jgi:alpha-1,6-mannosyltransferase
MRDADRGATGVGRLHTWYLLAVGVSLVGLSCYIAMLGDLSISLTRFIIAFGLQFALYIVAIRIVFGLRDTRTRSLLLIFTVAIACRLPLIGSTPTLSNDIYRYLWEGRVIGAGFNPFSHAPDAPELEFLRDENFDAINHKHLQAIYPPAAQAAFVVGAFAHNGILSQKIIFALFDLATMVLLLLWLRARKRRPVLCAIYGWSPLVGLEFAHAGHMDSLGIFFLVLAALFFEKRRDVVGIVALALSFLAKYLSLVLVPFFICKRRYSAKLWIFAAVAVAGFLPFLGASTKLFSSLGVYGRHWNFNSVLFTGLEGLSISPDLIRATILLITALFAIYQGYRQTDFSRFAFLVIGCALLLSPTVYPWYVCWIVPFLCVFASWGWLFFSGAVVISYTVWHVYAQTGTWQVPAWALAIEYVPFFALLACDAYRARRLRRGAD